MTDKNSYHQAILARHIIDMGRENATNPDILEYLDSFCWELFMIFNEQPQEVIKWDILSSIYDQQCTALRQGEDPQQFSELDDIYAKVSGIVESRQKK